MEQKKIKIKRICIDSNASILDTLKLMDLLGVKSLILVNEVSIFEGIVSIGDIQRAIIRNEKLEKPLKDIIRPNPRIAKPGIPISEVINQMMQFRMEFLPVINDSQEIVDCFFWDDVLQGETPRPVSSFNLPVVIMAGGIGTRLKPLTNVLPKPLIPIGNKTMLEEIFERFSSYGCNEFYISVNYKASLIEYYIHNQNLPYNLTFFKEEKPLGTAGSLSLLKSKIDKTFFVSNCDILIEQDYSEILDFHRSNYNDITILAALKHFAIPYGTIETGENGKLINLIEKPELTYKINTGMYILEPHLISEIPVNTYFQITDLIENAKNKGLKIGVFPISEKSWKDIGAWDEYLKYTNKNENFNEGHQ